MKIIERAAEMTAEVAVHQRRGESTGFVPTMGALHQGHMHLIRTAREENPVTVCSIFVNPLQFNNKEDFEKYPSTLDADQALLSDAGCDLLFHPDYGQVYGDEPPRQFELGRLNEVMEGHFRPGHFQGVANVVYRFFDIVRPDKAYFGLKDYQQYLVIRNVVAPYFPGLEIVGVETVRDGNGLAMSSRNMRLTPAQYASAIQVPAILQQLCSQWSRAPQQELLAAAAAAINAIPELKLEYLEFAHATSLEPARDQDDARQLRLFTAFYAGPVRLIDNMALGL